MKLKSWVKKWVDLWSVENDGGFLPKELSDHDMMSTTRPGDVFSSIITHMKISKKFMKEIVFEVLAFFQIGLIFTYISLI